MKQNRNKKWRYALGAVLGAVFCLMTLHPAYASGRQVYDDAGIFSEDEIDEITKVADEVEDKTGWDLIILTVDDTSVTSNRDYAEEKFNKYTKSDDGVVYLFNMDEDKNGWNWYIATAGEAYEYLGDSQIEEMLDDAAKYDLDGDYAQSMIAMIEDTESYYTSNTAKNMTIYDEDQGIYYASSTNHRFLSYGEIAIAAVLGVAACLIFCLVITGKYRLKFGRYHYNAREHAQINLRRNEDHFVRQFVTRRKIPKDPPKNGGGGGGTSTIHQGAGGRSFGGGGRSF